MRFIILTVFLFIQQLTALAFSQQLDIKVDTNLMNNIKYNLNANNIQQEIYDVENNIKDIDVINQKIQLIDKKFEVDNSSLIIYLCSVYILLLLLIYFIAIKNE